MKDHTLHQRIIFGLKVKQLRQHRNLSGVELAKKIDLSVSYLNEIEKGKKYPKDDKIELLAQALDTTAEALTSEELSRNLMPVADLLNSNFLNELPLDLFGLELTKIVELVANAPIKVGAFISTLVELGRSYAVREENFYYRALRAYQELHNNYFEDIEQEALRFVQHYSLPTNKAVASETLKILLEQEFDYTILEDGLKNEPLLQSYRAIVVPHRKQLLLNEKLSERQLAYQLAKELGFNYLGLTERALTKAKNFEEVLNNYKAAYFAVAILINQEEFIKDIQTCIEQPTWNEQFFLDWMEKYQVSTETLFQRFNVLPKFFGLDKLFFLRIFHNVEKNSFEIDKELHLYRKHFPHSNGLSEHYCRRWVSLASLEEVQNKQLSENIVRIQKARYVGTTDEYLCFSIARPAYPTPNRNVSVTVGLLIDNNLRQKINFTEDPSIPTQEVGVTCERCPIENCAERAAAPSIIERRARRRLTQEALERLMT